MSSLNLSLTAFASHRSLNLKGGEKCLEHRREFGEEISYDLSLMNSGDLPPSVLTRGVSNATRHK